MSVSKGGNRTIDVDIRGVGSALAIVGGPSVIGMGHLQVDAVDRDRSQFRIPPDGGGTAESSLPIESIARQDDVVLGRGQVDNGVAPYVNVPGKGSAVNPRVAIDDYVPAHCGVLDPGVSIDGHARPDVGVPQD